MKVSDILRVKGNTLYTVTPDEPLGSAAELMADKDIGSLVVMEHGDLVGMLTFREVIQCIVKKKFVAPNGAVIKPGATFHFQRLEGQTFPYDVLEPVNKSMASGLRKEFLDKRDARIADQEDARKAREAISNLALAATR